MNENENIAVEETINEDIITMPEQCHTSNDSSYRLEESLDEMQQAIDNASKVRTEQQYLVDVLTNINDDKLKPLIASLSTQVTELDTQISVLNKRLQLITNVVNAAHEDNYRQVINDLLDGLGVFNE